MPRILVVESEQTLLLTIKDELESAGYQVDPSITGEEALRKVENKPDLVLVDERLADMSGLDFIQQMKKHDYTKSVPSIILLEVGDEALANQAMELGVSRYYIKTRYGLGGLLEDLSKLLSEKT